jgi:hypothetical protein
LAKKGLTRNILYAIFYSRAKIAQSVEHSTENAGVGGSIPPLGIHFFEPKLVSEAAPSKYSRKKNILQKTS